MAGAGLLSAILLGLIRHGALSTSAAVGGGSVSAALSLEGAGFRRTDDVSLESPALAWWGGTGVYREDGPLPRRVRGASGPPDWGSAPAWWMTSGLDSAHLLGESETCQQLLQEFAESSAALADCVKSSGNVTCSKQLLRSDRLQIVLKMHNYLQKIWIDSLCDACLNGNKTAPSVDTVIFKKMLNDSLNCFDHYSSERPDHGNHSDLCIKCKVSYNNLTKWYNGMANKQRLCIDIVDAMNLTRQLWSKTYNCTVPCSDTIPVIAVSTFLLFLPVIFYLSSFLHSEQKKWKLIEPKRLKPCSSAARIEDQPC
ncbi:osteopetrosis-associated transmembrane protein 1 isoform X2 [Heterodontus francisci]|uniref:osteopetrosis-associated transmembrane protein 1 isoform X2 n=1 Tax=Heterodontus francisci TaxID=7792 RepID=UPI00355C866F